MDIGIDALLTVPQLQAAMAALLPGLRVVAVDAADTWPDDLGDVLVLRDEGQAGFPTLATLFLRLRPSESEEVWLGELARARSDRLAVRTISDGTRHGDRPSPYWSLVWDAGLPYLADDAGWEDGQPPRIVRALGLSSFAPPAASLAARVDTSRRPPPC